MICTKESMTDDLVKIRVNDLSKSNHEKNRRKVLD